MNKNEKSGVRAGGTDIRNELSRDADAARSRVNEEAQAASDMLADGQAALKEKASHLASAVRDEAVERSEQLKERTADGLDVFTRAVRNASDELARKDLGVAADLVRQAAGGLEALSGTLHRKSAGEMVDAVRTFAGRNPAAFIAGSVLAGFALGRIGSAARTAPSTLADPDSADPGSANLGLERASAAVGRQPGGGI